MDKIINSIVAAFIQKEIISEEYAEWFRYSLEKRLLTVLIGIPFFIFAVFLSGIRTAVSFYFSFYFLRSRMNGYHAKSVGICLVSSLLLEFFFLGIVNSIITDSFATLLMVIVIALALILGPYNHPNMHLSKAEYAACKKSTQVRSAILSLIFLIALIMGFKQIMRGITLGSAMAGTLLSVAYIFDWRSKHGRKRNQA